jgi:hypothetical protein
MTAENNLINWKEYHRENHIVQYRIHLYVLAKAETLSRFVFSSLVTTVSQCWFLMSLLLVLTEYQNNFNTQSLQNTTYNFQYDYDSIMHYGQYFFRSVLLSLLDTQRCSQHAVHMNYTTQVRLVLHGMFLGRTSPLPLQFLDNSNPHSPCLFNSIRKL